jgi:hypothetical protein
MPNFATLDGDMELAAITNIIVADTLEDATETARLSNLGSFCLLIPDGLFVDTNWLWVKDKFVSREEYTENNADI